MFVASFLASKISFSSKWPLFKTIPEALNWPQSSWNQTQSGPGTERVLTSDPVQSSGDHVQFSVWTKSADFRKWGLQTRDRTKPGNPSSRRLTNTTAEGAPTRSCGLSQGLRAGTLPEPHVTLEGSGNPGLQSWFDLELEHKKTRAQTNRSSPTGLGNGKKDCKLKPVCWAPCLCFSLSPNADRGLLRIPTLPPNLLKNKSSTELIWRLNYLY